jgi:hypothetical protein
VPLSDRPYNDEACQGHPREDQNLPENIDTHQPGDGSGGSAGGEHGEDQRQAEHLCDDKHNRRNDPPNPGIHITDRTVPRPAIREGSATP